MSKLLLFWQVLFYSHHMNFKYVSKKCFQLISPIKKHILMVLDRKFTHVFPSITQEYSTFHYLLLLII